MDGEDLGIEPDQLNHHLATCTACRNWEADAVSLARAVRVHSADEIPDLTAGILASIGREPAPARRGIGALRVALGVVALFTIFLNAQDLFFADYLGHTTRELASFELALGVGFAAAAWRPVRAYGMVPLVGAFMVMLVAGTAANGDSFGEMITEGVHALQVAGALLITGLSRAASPPADRTARFRLLRA
jgi:predicted anti-sigma-YlaC factor YlaD